MTDKELIQALREDIEWAQANEWETPITLGDNLAEAADRLEALLAENERLTIELQAYKDTGLTPEEAAEYKKFEDEAVSKGVPFSRIVELMNADKDGRLLVRPKSEDGTCGSCQHFKRIMGTRRGTCAIRPFLVNKWGCAQPERETFEPSQSRKCCKQYSCREGAEQAVKEAK